MKASVPQGDPNDKARWREAVGRKLSELSPLVRAEESQKLAAILENWAFAQGFEVVLATLPFDDEPVLTPFIDRWLASGRKLALARTGPARSLTFRYVENLLGPWETKAWGLREPSSTLPLWKPGPSTLCVVPGLAFDPSPTGTIRLGRGAGYYDRWLERHRTEVFSLGVGFSVQRVESLPFEAHDQRLDGLITPTGLILNA